MIWTYYKTNISGIDNEYSSELAYIDNWIRNNDMQTVEAGRHDVDGDRLYVNILEYETKDETECIWEAHKKYLDLHFIICGTETIGISYLDNMQIGEFEDDKDYLHISGDADVKITCREGSMILLYPEDAHKTSIRVDNSNRIKKAVFKIRIHKPLL